jgi:hypothetical protein
LYRLFYAKNPYQSQQDERLACGSAAAQESDQEQESTYSGKDPERSLVLFQLFHEACVNFSLLHDFGEMLCKLLVYKKFYDSPKITPKNSPKLAHRENPNMSPPNTKIRRFVVNTKNLTSWFPPKAGSF